LRCAGRFGKVIHRIRQTVQLGLLPFHNAAQSPEVLFHIIDCLADLACTACD
jgi:hypothetical protein